MARCAAVYVALAVVMGWDVLRSIGTRIASDVGDPLLNAAILTWNARTVPWTDAWYQFPIYHPAADALTFSEHLLGVSAIATPIYWLTQNGLTAYNLALWLSYPLSALAMFALVWRLTRSAPAAFLAGLAFGFAPYRAAQLPHIQVLIVFWAPLALFGLHAYFETGRWRWLALFAVAWLLQGLSNGYFLVYFSVVVGLWILWFGVAARRWRETLIASAALAVAALPLVPILYRYVVAHARYGFSWGPDVVREFGADITGAACPATGLSVWGWMGGFCGAESQLFLGPSLAVLGAMSVWAMVTATPVASTGPRERLLAIVSRALMLLSLPFLAGGIAFAMYGPWAWSFGPVSITGSSAAKPFTNGVLLLIPGLVMSRTFRTMIVQQRTAAFYLTAAVVTWALSWGPLPQLRDVTVLPHGPYALLQLLPGADGLRVPARFWMMTVLCVCVLGGVAGAQGLRRLSPRASIAVIIVAAMGLLTDGWMPIPAAPLPIPELSPAPPPGSSVMVLPLRWNDQSAEFRAIAGGWTSINGASGHEPGFYRALTQLSDTYDPLLFDPFLVEDDLHVAVYSGSQLIEVVERQPGVVALARGGQMLQYRIPRRGRPALAAAAGDPLAIASVAVSCGQERIAEATDGNPATRWHCGAQNKDAAFTIDLGAVKPVAAVTAATGPFTRDFPRRLIVEVSTDGERWEEVWAGSGLAAALEAELRTPAVTPVTIAFEPRSARYLRLRQVGRDDMWWWSIAELEVRAGPGGN